MIAGLLALTLTAVTAAGIAVHNAANATRQAANATRQHAIALSRQLAAESLTIAPANPVTARRLAVAAWRVFPTDQASSAMTTLLTEQQQNGILPADPSTVNGVAFSPDGKLLASAGARRHGAVVGSGHRPGRPHDPSGTTSPNSGVNGVAFSPDGKLLASAGGDGTVRLWDPVTGRAVRTIHADTIRRQRRRVRGGVQPGRQAAGQRRRRRHGAVVGSGHRPGRPRDPGRHHRRATSACSGWRSARTASCWPAPARRRGGTVRLWDPVTGRAVRTIQAATAVGNGGVFGVAFSPDGKLLASAGSAAARHGAVVGSGHRPGRPHDPSGTTSPSSGVHGVAFSPDGKLLASAGGDGTVRLWDPATGRPVRTIQATGRHDGVYGVAFSPGGKLLASAGADGTVRLWDPATGRAVAHDPGRHRRPTAACSGWRSAPAASCWPAPAPTARCGCGIRSPAGPSARSKPAAPAATAT